MDNTFFDIRVLAIYAQHLRHKHIIIKQEQTPVAQNFPQQKTTWKILSGWRFNTIVTTSLPYSIYSGILQPKLEVRFDIQNALRKGVEIPHRQSACACALYRIKLMFANNYWIASLRSQ